MNRRIFNLLAIGITFAVATSLIAFAHEASPVEAHALLVRSEPAAGTKLAEAPERATAWFSEPLEPGVSRLRVLAGGGTQVDEGEVQFNQADPTQMSVALDEDVGPGFYLVTWETLSQVDGHFRFGSFEFTVLNTDGSEPSGPRPEGSFDVTGTPTGAAEGAVTKIAQLIGVVALVGVLASAVLVLPPALSQLNDGQRRRLADASRRYVAWVGVGALVTLTLAGLLELWLQARQFGGVEDVDTVLATQWGERWLIRHFLLIGMALFLAAHLQVDARLLRGNSLPLWLAFAGTLGYLLLVALVSHANAIAQGSFWATSSDFIHLATAAFWIGGLVSLAALFMWGGRGLHEGDRPAVLTAALQRFSLIAGTSLLLLIATGIFNALVETSSFSQLIETAYGRALLAKLILIVPLLGIAGLNAVVLRPQLVRSAATDGGVRVEPLRMTMSRLMALEAALAVAVLALVGVLTQYTPSRVEAEASAALAAGVSALPDSQATGRDEFGFPLSLGDWYWVAGGSLVLAAILVWGWAGYLRRDLSPVRPVMRTASLGLAVIGAFVVLAGVSQAPSPSSAFDTAVAFRYQATDDRLVLLEIEPFQVGRNEFKVTVMTESEEVVPVESVELQFSDLEQDATAEAVVATSGDGQAHFAEHELQRTGWWEIGVVIVGDASARFYLRLDDPSLAPLEFTPPDYEADPAAEQLFRQALQGYELLSSLRWREELTSGLLDPTGIGAWVLTDGRAEAPEKISYQVFSPGYSDYQNVRVGSKSCFQDRGEAWECRGGAGRESFELEYLEPSTAFRLGRREMLDGEMTQVLLFNNPSQAGAWYAWWIGEETGYLRRQAMVAPGHFMLTHYYGHNEPVDIELPPEADNLGG